MGMSRIYRPWNPGQSFLFPVSPEKWLPEDHLVYFVLDLVRELDLSEIYEKEEEKVQGRPAYSPRLMMALLLYSYCVGVPSSRRIERRTYEDVAFRILTSGEHPDHTRISEFRRRHLAALSGLFVQILKLCQKAGMVRLGHVALDGSKFKANASKRKAMSYKRMLEEEQRLEKLVKELLAKAEGADISDDQQYGECVRGDALPEDLQRAKTRLARIQELRSELEREAREQREAEEKEAEPKGEALEPVEGKETLPSPDLPSHKIPRQKDGTPTDKAQRNFTDPESRIMKCSSAGIVQAYNCQAAVDEGHQIIVAQAVTNQPPDCQHLRPLLDQVEDNLGELPTVLTADNGYFSKANVEYAKSRLVEPYIAPGRRKRGEPPPKVRGRIPRGLSPKQRMQRKLGTKKGARIYARRKAVVEPVFGQTKEARGLRRLLLRGIEKVRGEFSLIALTHNLLELYRNLGSEGLGALIRGS
jgi:transposase